MFKEILQNYLKINHINTSLCQSNSARIFDCWRREALGYLMDVCRGHLPTYFTTYALFLLTELATVSSVPGNPPEHLLRLLGSDYPNHGEWGASIRCDWSS